MTKRLLIAVAFLASAASAGAVETQIKGGRMQLLNKGEVVKFTDGVRLDRGGDTLIADRMTARNNREHVEAYGSVALTRVVSPTETWKGFGATGSYNTTTGEGHLAGEGRKTARIQQLTAVSSTITRKMDIYAERFEFYEQRSSAAAFGKVYGKAVDPETKNVYEFWADKAYYDGTEKKITLRGKKQPRLMQTEITSKRTMYGDVIIYYLDTRKLISKGRAKSVFVDLDPNARNKKKKK